MTLTLVTGATGWLGTRLIEALVKGIPEVPSLASPDPNRHVRCLVLPGVDTTVFGSMADRIDLCVGDLRNPADVQAFCDHAAGATLFHCAGVIHPTQGVRELFAVNVEGTRNLLQAAEQAGVRRVIVVSSNSPLGVSRQADHCFDESSPYNPYMAYGRSKMQMEQVTHAFQARGKLETVIVRPPWFYGPYQPPRQTLFFTMIKNGSVPIVGNGNNRRSMVYIDNLCYGLLLCEHAPQANGQTYWIADRRPYTMNEIVDTIERLLSTEFHLPVVRKRMRLPTIVGELATVVDGTLQHFQVYHQKIHVLSEMNKTIACSIEKARTTLGFEPTVDLETGMHRSIQWCLDQGYQI